MEMQTVVRAYYGVLPAAKRLLARPCGSGVGSPLRPPQARKLSTARSAPGPLGCLPGGGYMRRPGAPPWQKLMWTRPHDTLSSSVGLRRTTGDLTLHGKVFSSPHFSMIQKACFSLKMFPQTLCQSINLSSAAQLPALFLNVRRETRAQARPPASTSGRVGSPTPGNIPRGWQRQCIC